MTTVFLTGATGFLGHYTLAALLARDDVRVRALVSPPVDVNLQRLARTLSEIDLDLHSAISAGRVSWTKGRLPDQLAADALDGVDVVLHAAASTRFQADASGEPARSIVDGTQALLDAARIAKVARFVYVSTAYVGGMASGTLAEASLDSCADDANAYERSKWRAEQAVLAWQSRNRTAIIVRPSILIGDVATGRSTSFGGVYVLARAVELLARAAEHDATLDRRRIPLRIVGAPDSPVNLIPVCRVARHLAVITTQAPDARRVIHLVNPRPPSNNDIRQWLEDVFDVAGGRFTDQAWPFPDPSACEEAFYAAGDSVHAYFRRGRPFECGYLRANGENAPLVSEASFKSAIEYARDRQWGRRPQPTLVVENAKASGVDPAEYFERFMPDRLSKSSVNRIDGFNAVVRYVIDDTENGEWVCRYAAGRIVEIRRGSNTLHEDFGFRVRRDAFEKIVTGRQSLQASYFQSEAEIFGNTFMALKMVPIVDTFLREHPMIADSR